MTKIDVLAVMDDILSVSSGMLVEEIENLRNARTAVAELIDAAMTVVRNDATCDLSSNDIDALEQAIDRAGGNA